MQRALTGRRLASSPHEAAVMYTARSGGGGEGPHGYLGYALTRSMRPLPPGSHTQHSWPPGSVRRSHERHATPRTQRGDSHAVTQANPDSEDTRMPHGGRGSGTTSPATAAAETAASTAGGGRALRYALVGYAIPQMHATNPPGYLTQRDTSLHTTRHPWGAGERTRTHSGRADSLAGVARHRQWSSPHASDRPQPQGLSVPPWREQALGGTLAPAVTLTPRVRDAS